MRVKSKELLFLLIAGVTVGILLNLSEKNDERYETQSLSMQCSNQLNALSFAIFSYREENTNRFPANLETAYATFTSSDRFKGISRCPVAMDGFHARYSYVNREKWFPDGKVPGDYPVIFESDARSHGGGVFIVLANTKVFWDNEGVWLREFINANPHYEIQTPVGLPSSAARTLRDQP